VPDLPVDQASGKDRPESRRPLSVYGVGTEPDPRFSLANERTALAWVRTGLALIAGGIALTSVAAVADLPTFLDLVAVLACLFGAVTAVNALLSWQRVERAMRLGNPLPAPTALRWLVVAVVLAGLVLAVYAALQI
jgi:putative membrane protein